MTRHTKHGRPLGRRPGPENTRPAIMAAARDLFAEVGFERATVRAIAARAGVDPAMINHHFGTKDELLVAVLDLPFDPARLADAIVSRPGQEGVTLVRTVLALWSDPAVRDHMRTLIRVAMSRPEAAEAFRNLYASRLVSVIAGVVPRDDAAIRAGLVATQLSGLALLRIVLPLDAIADADEQTLIDTIGPTIQRYLTGDLADTATDTQAAEASQRGPRPTPDRQSRPPRHALSGVERSSSDD